MASGPNGLAVCLAMAASPAAATGTVPSTPGLDLYMTARVADREGAVAQAAAGYAAALAASPDNPVVALRAYREAIRAGDLDLADRAAAVLAAHHAGPADAPLLAIARAAAAGDAAAARRAVAGLESGPLRVLTPALDRWIAGRAGGDVPVDPVAQRFARESDVLLQLGRGDVAAGMAAIGPLIATERAGVDQAAQDLRLAAARLLIGRGQEGAARALLVGDASPVAALRDRPRGQGARPTLAFGVAYLFTRIASDLSPGDPGPIGYALIRGALRADPGDDRARILLAAALSKDDAVDRGIAELAQIRPDSIYAANARAGRVQLLAAKGDTEAAVAEARVLAQAPGATDADRLRLADLYLRFDQPVDAAAIFRALTTRVGAVQDGTLWLQYGAALDRAGQWQEARAALERAVALAPGDPIALNYLGYALVEHGEQPDTAQALLERAAALKPGDAAITDSLGWSLLRRGQVARAIPLIERAAAADPANAEIGEHLGDAYWQAGRRYEARYAWTAARVSARPPATTRLDAKIADGL
ncbi:tetratricopeptide repeat protein [uncultured Sphingomonas sp.]|uniref:tetratricopeptide repeat protein n=1 Tax=uncultured Sphingomonas sp. TaxID=158754 RepID=UPI0030D816FB